jgi:hypothetical protein
MADGLDHGLILQRVSGDSGESGEEGGGVGGGGGSQQRPSAIVCCPHDGLSIRLLSLLRGQ